MKNNGKTLALGLATVCMLVILSVAEAGNWNKHPLTEERVKEIKDAILVIAAKGKLNGIKGKGLEFASVDGAMVSFQNGFPMPDIDRGFNTHLDVFDATDGMARTVMCPEKWCAIGNITPVKRKMTKFRVIALLGKEFPKQDLSGVSAFFYPNGYYSHSSCGVKYTIKDDEEPIVEIFTAGC